MRTEASVGLGRAPAGLPARWSCQPPCCPGPAASWHSGKGSRPPNAGEAAGWAWGCWQGTGGPGARACSLHLAPAPVSPTPGACPKRAGPSSSRTGQGAGHPTQACGAMSHSVHSARCHSPWSCVASAVAAWGPLRVNELEFNLKFSSLALAGGSVGWSSVRCTEGFRVQFPFRALTRLWVRSPVGVHRGSNRSTFLSLPRFLSLKIQ